MHLQDIGTTLLLHLLFGRVYLPPRFYHLLLSPLSAHGVVLLSISPPQMIGQLMLRFPFRPCCAAWTRFTGR
jgi:hypothetical protein